MSIIDYALNPFFLISVSTIAIIYNGIIKEFIKTRSYNHKKTNRRAYHYIILALLTYLYYIFMENFSKVMKVEDSNALSIMLIWLESIVVYEIGLKIIFNSIKSVAISVADKYVKKV